MFKDRFCQREEGSACINCTGYDDFRYNIVPEVGPAQVSMLELKNHVSEWLGRVQAVEAVDVTSHRKPIARITAVKQQDQGGTTPLKKAMDAGLISWSCQKSNFPPPVKLNDGGPLTSDLVIEDRGEKR